VRVLAVALALLASCSSRPSENHCERAIDHMIAIIAAPQVPGGGAVPAEATRNAEVWKKLVRDKDPVRATLLETCRERMTDSVASCILEARDEASLAACFR
jgi:hypothetical protein